MYNTNEIKEYYSSLSCEDQIEVSMLIEEKLREKLISFLYTKGFCGTDDSLEISLFHYDVVYRERDGLTIFCLSTEDGLKFDALIIENNYLLGVIKSMVNGFFEYINCSKAEYIAQFNKESNKSMFIRDIRNYNDKLGEYYNCDNNILYLLQNLDKWD